MSKSKQVKNIILAFTLTRDQNMQYIPKGDNKVYSRRFSCGDKGQLYLSLKSHPKILIQHSCFYD